MLPKMSVASPISNMYLMGIPMASNKTYEIPSIMVINRNHPIAVENIRSSPYSLYKYGTQIQLPVLNPKSVTLSYYIMETPTNK